MDDNINVVLADMPTTIKEYVVANKDMSYTIVLNSRHSYETRFKAYNHAMKHIINGDFDKDSSADLIEIYAHKERKETT